MTGTSPVLRRRDATLVLAAVCLAALILPMSFSGGAVATLAIGRDLGGSPVALNWITNGFMLTFGGFQMAAGACADRFGRKKLFTGGVMLFALTSLALACAPSVAWVDGLRLAQGLAAAATLAGGAASLAQEFDGHARLRAFSLLGTTFGFGLAFGPLLAGFLIANFGWRSVFLTTLALAFLALGFGAPRMRESYDPDAQRFDWPGMLAFTGALSLFTLGMIEAPLSGWTSPLIIALLCGSVISLGAFVVIENKTSRPMLELSLFRYPRFVGVQALPVATCYSYIVLLILLPLRFIGIEGYSETAAGLLMLSLSAPMLAIPSLAAMLTRWMPAGVICSIGLLIAAAGLFWLSRIEIGTRPDALILPLLTIGFGAGMPWGLMDGLSISVVPKERAGMAAGIFNTTRVAGEGIALAIVNALLAGLSQVALRLVLEKADLASADVAAAAEHLATGDLNRAAALLPSVTHAALLRTYGDAFTELLLILMGITIVSASIVLACLSRDSSRIAEPKVEEICATSD